MEERDFGQTDQDLETKKPKVNLKYLKKKRKKKKRYRRVFPEGTDKSSPQAEEERRLEATNREEKFLEKFKRRLSRPGSQIGRDRVNWKRRKRKKKYNHEQENFGNIPVLGKEVPWFIHRKLDLVICSKKVDSLEKENCQCNVVKNSFISKPSCDGFLG